MPPPTSTAGDGEPEGEPGGEPCGTPDNEPSNRVSRRAMVTGVAAAALAGAGAGGAAGAALGGRTRGVTHYRLTPGDGTKGGDGPWTHVPPGGDVQAAIDAGAKAILLGDGTYEVREPIRPTAGCVIRGIGKRTRLHAAVDLSAMIAIGDGGSVDAVQVSDLVVDCAGRADSGIDLNIVGTDAFGDREPDAVCRLDDLWVYDAGDDGVVYRGSDTQACVSSRIRVRRARRHGFRVEAPDNVWVACEATTTEAGGAGFYVGTAIKGSNGIGAGNCHFHACKAWYCRGVGWYVNGSRSTFVGCEAQDTASHGWRIEQARNIFTACSADTAAMADVGGTPSGADGFSVTPDRDLSLVGCVAFDRRPGGIAAQQRYGFDVPAALVSDQLLVAPIGWGNVGGLVHRR